MTSSKEYNVYKRTGYVDKLFLNGSTGPHVASAYIGKGFMCGCMGFKVRKQCKHTDEIKKIMTTVNIDEILDEKVGKKFGSSLEDVDKLFDDELYNDSEIVTLYGKPKTGKTLYAIQEACKLTAEGNNVLIIDTEGSLRSMLAHWVPIFEDRFGKRKGNILVETARDIHDLMNYLGFEVTVTYKQKKKGANKGKLVFEVVEEVKNNLKKIADKNDIDMIILDSLTSPLRRFTKQQQNYPNRGDATTFIFHALLDVMDDMNCGCLVTNHASFNPTNPYQTKADATGGIIVHYYTKRMIYLDKRKSKSLRDYRRFWLVRGEKSPEWERAVATKITDEGYQEIDRQNTLKKVFTSAEKSKLDQVIGLEE